MCERERERKKGDPYVRERERRKKQDNNFFGRINEEMTMNSGGTAQIARQKLTCMFEMGQKS